MTPSLPTWLTTFALPGYTNAYSLLPAETRLYGTESLYGDWNARILLLAKDFAPSRILRDRITAAHPRPYSHEPTLKTNVRLQQLTGHLALSPDPTACGLLYGSALASLCRDDGRMSGTLPSRTAALAFGARVLTFALNHLPCLRAIVCMGEEAWLVTAATLGINADWRDSRESCAIVRVNRISIIAAYHPAARVAHAESQRAWEQVSCAIT